MASAFGEAKGGLSRLGDMELWDATDASAGGREPPEALATCGAARWLLGGLVRWTRASVGICNFPPCLTVGLGGWWLMAAGADWNMFSTWCWEKGTSVVVQQALGWGRECETRGGAVLQSGAMPAFDRVPKWQVTCTSSYPARSIAHDLYLAPA